MIRSRRSLRPALAALALVLTARSATADERATSDHDRARAQQLFESALADVEAGRFAVACPKFAASHGADPKTSTLLNLGSCYESLGKTASAWAAFREAEGLARTIGRADLEAAARARAENLAPKLVRLTIAVPAADRAPGLVVSRDGRHLSAAEWGVGIPVDDGEHDISAEAPGRRPWRERIVVRGKDRTVAVPRLEVAPSPPRSSAAPAPEPAPAATWWTPMRTVGVALGGAGAASLVTGLVLGFVAKSDYDGARAQCVAVDDCPAGAARDGESARSLANGATVLIASGAVVAAAGGALILLAPRPSAAREAGARQPIRASVAIGPGSLGVRGQW